MRRVWIVALVGLWIALLLNLEGDDGSITGDVALPTSLALPFAGSWQYSVIRSHGKRVGESKVRLAPTATGFAVEEATKLRLTVLGVRQAVATRLEAQLDATGAVREVAVQLDSFSGRVRARATRLGDSLLRVDLKMGTQRTSRDLVSPEPLHLPLSLRRRLAARLEPGASVAGLVFDALVGDTERLTLRVIGPGDELGTWAIEESYRGLKSEIQMRADGVVVRERGPLGLETTLLQRAEAAPVGGEAYLDVEAVTAIAVEPISGARTRRQLRLRIGGVDARHLPQSAGQQLNGDVLTLERPALDTFPCWPIGALAPGAAAWLQADSTMQSDEPRVRALAQEIVGATADTIEATRRLVEWVYTYLTKEGTIGVPNALATLDSGRGDCNEHAVLLVALARAAEIPARPVAGVVYMDGKFVYHAWAEILVGNDWLAVDPAFGQVPADATHIALAGGVLSDAAQMLALVGRLELTLEP